MPQARAVIEHCHYHELPASYDALRNKTAAFEDCAHEFYSTKGQQGDIGGCTIGKINVGQIALPTLHPLSALRAAVLSYMPPA